VIFGSVPLYLRRLFLVLLLAGLLALPASAARAALERTASSAYLQLLDGRGTAKVRYLGNFLGRVGRGRIVATRNVTVSGWSHRRVVSSRLIAYRGRHLSFRTPPDARWRLRLRGRNIAASGFVRGCMRLNGANSGDPGDFRIGESSPLRRWPRTSTGYRLGGGC
jgi:hypothetical protein